MEQMSQKPEDGKSKRFLSSLILAIVLILIVLGVTRIASISVSQAILKIQSFLGYFEEITMGTPDVRVKTSKREMFESLRTASILEPPFPANIACFGAGPNWVRFGTECDQASFKNHSCWRSINPVHDTQGNFYPSACWAEEAGVTKYKYGNSDRITQFVSDLWYIPKAIKGTEWSESLNVPKPHIVYSYGSEEPGGSHLRSVLWQGNTEYRALNYYFNVNGAPKVTLDSFTTSRPVSNVVRKTLLAFVQFDTIYPEKLLLDSARTYAHFLNIKLREQQELANPLQFDVTPVVVPLTPAIERTTGNIDAIDSGIRREIYDVAVTRAGKTGFDLFIISFVTINHPHDTAGRYRQDSAMDVIRVAADTLVSYSEEDEKNGLLAFSWLPATGALWHEMLHMFGLPHDPNYEYGYWIDLTGRKDGTIIQECDVVDSSYYAVELPEGLKVKVGEEPYFLYKVESRSGPCLESAELGTILKDYDRDGEYELMYRFEAVDPIMQEVLGWVDIDGDGIGEVEDLNPYGGYQELLPPTHSGFSIIGPYTFDPLEEVTIEDCVFKKIRLENSEIGLAPLHCAEFNRDVVNLYKQIKYLWIKIPREYGTIFLARLPL